MSEEIRLSSSGMHRVCEHDRERFVFVVGGREYECGLLEACFLSPKVSRLLMGDCTMNRLTLDVEDSEGYFERVVCLGFGGSLTLDNANHDVIKSLASSLENIELYGLVTSFELKGEAINLDNVVNRLSVKVELGLDSREEIAFIASHFYEFADFSSLGLCELERILCDETLKLKDENSLVDIIISLCEGNDDFFSLFRYVHVEYVDLSHLERYFEHVYPDHLDVGVWSRICDCLRFRLDSGSASHSRSLEKTRFISGSSSSAVSEEFAFNGSPFSGILKKLSEECGGNVHDKGVVQISESTGRSDSWGKNCTRVTDYGWNSWWWSDDSPNAWLRFDFKDKAVNVTGYSIKSGGSTGDHLLQWVIEGSIDGIEWTTLDQRNTLYLNGKFLVKTYECKSGGSGRYRYVRLRQTGKNSSGYDYLGFSEIEFFGTLYRRST